MIKLCLVDKKICQNCSRFKAEQTTDALYAQNEICYRHIIKCVNDEVCTSIRDHISSRIERR